jgi:hypothetical protein
MCELLVDQSCVDGKCLTLSLAFVAELERLNFLSAIAGSHGGLAASLPIYLPTFSAPGESISILKISRAGYVLVRRG